MEEWIVACAVMTLTQQEELQTPARHAPQTCTPLPGAQQTKRPACARQGLGVLLAPTHWLILTGKTLVRVLCLCEAAVRVSKLCTLPLALLACCDVQVPTNLSPRWLRFQPATSKLHHKSNQLCRVLPAVFPATSRLMDLAPPAIHAKRAHPTRSHCLSTSRVRHAWPSACARR